MSRIRTLAIGGVLAAGASLLSAGTADAHVSICKNYVHAPVVIYGNTLYADGSTYCPTDSHNTSVKVQIEIKKDLSLRPDPAVARSAVKTGGGAGQTTYVNTAGLCSSYGRGSYYAVVTHTANGHSGPSYPASTSSYRVTLC
jgi:hypothetical protein